MRAISWEAPMKVGWQPEKWLRKRTKAGFRGYPVGTVAFYGPDDRRASKVAVAILNRPESEPIELRRWCADDHDIRTDATVFAEVAAFLREYEPRSIAMVEGIIGCPHEEGVDYPEGEACPQCPFWAGRDRFSAVTKTFK
jgi:hypothetical protein